MRGSSGLLLLVVACAVAWSVTKLVVVSIWDHPLPSTQAGLIADLPRDSVDAARYPGSFRPQQRLADVLLRLGRARDAEAPARRAAALAPRQASARATLGVVLAGEGQIAAAAVELQAAIDRGSPDPRTPVVLGWAYEQLRQDSAAARVYAAALRRYANDPMVAGANALFLIRHSRPDALPAAQRVVALAPGWAPAHQTLAMAYAARSDAHHAREEMQRAADLFPSYYGYWANLGAYAFLDGDTSAAWVAFSRARALDSAHVDAIPSWRAMWSTANAAHH